MGLEMYLTKEYCINAAYSGDIECNIKVKRRGKHLSINAKKVDSISEFFMYWHKAYPIHNWFVNNVQGGIDNCAKYYVPFEQLMRLKALCKKILENAALAPELLPAEEYDEAYYAEVARTYNALIDIEEELFVGYYYYSCW